MAQTATTQTAREASLARRRALTSQGKAALSNVAAGANAVNTGQQNHRAPTVAGTPAPGMPARKASRMRRDAMSSSGKAGIKNTDRTRVAPADIPQASSVVAADKSSVEGKCGCGCKDSQTSKDSTDASEATMSRPTRKVSAQVRKNVMRNSSRATSLARRQAMSSRGKASVNSSNSTVQTARAVNPDLSSRELAKELREQRSRQGKRGDKKSKPCGRTRPNGGSATGAAKDATWKVGASETAHGQTLTGTMVGRSRSVTGDEPSTCRAVTGTDYMGADIFREFCQSETGQNKPAKTPRKVSVTSTSRGNAVTGNKVGRSTKVTGDEPGTCKRVTGIEYVDARQSETFCNTKTQASPSKITGSETRKGKMLTGNNVGRSGKVTGDEAGSDRELTGSQYMQPGNGKAPTKVGISATLRGGSVSGTMIGRDRRVTGDEPGSCRAITGDDYIGQEQYSGFCEKTPKPQDRKVGVSNTQTGNKVTGTLTQRSGKVTGDEPGTCKVLTGTPYAGAEQYANYCEPKDVDMAVARTRKNTGRPGAVMTGQQPGIAGKMTGAGKGVCEDISGTPYVGSDQIAEVCPAIAADTNSPDFPQAIGAAPWQQFSVSQPSGGAQQGAVKSNVTGSSYEQGHITGPFGMATGKVTGTEEARFGNRQLFSSTPAVPQTAEMIEGRVKSRITGEGMDAGPKITGDDWERGDNVTGTEGTSAIKRNPTIQPRSGIPAAMMKNAKRNEEIQEPVSKVTGGSGNTEKGALITYSGGARG